MIILSYILGSVSFAIITSFFLKLQDPRSYGSQNPGATNVLRGGNKIAALFTLLGDVLKGYLSVFLIIQYRQELHINEMVVACVGIAVILGHVLPVFLKFRGGKGVATAIGVFFALSWKIALIMCVLWMILIYITKTSSLSALIVLLLCPFLSLYFMPIPQYQIAMLVSCVIVITRHRENIINLFNRKENKIDWN